MCFEDNDEFICTHLGDEEEMHHGAVIPPLFQTSLYVLDNTDKPVNSKVKQYVYGRSGNPTVDLLEKKIAALERAEDAKCFSSGMAAISSALLAFLSAGDHAVCVRNAYDPARIFIGEYLAGLGIEATFVKGDRIEDFESSIRGNTRLIYLESPVSQIFTLQDLGAVAKLARSKGIKTVVDNSWATPIFQKPCELGIDLVVHSLSKYMGGHSDVIAGAVAGNHADIDKLAGRERSLLGGILGPFEAWLLIRGIRTLPVRMRQHQHNALKISRYLSEHKRVRKVNYPGLQEHPQYELGMRQMKGYSGLMSIELDAEEKEIASFIRRLRLFKRGVSWGGFESLAVQGVYPGLVRLAIGLEDVDSILEDIDSSLAGLG